MFSKKYYYVLLVLILALCLSSSFSAGAEAQGNYGGTFKVGVSTAPTTLDWPMSMAVSVRHVAKYIFEGLLEFDNNDELQPMLAKEWKVSEDKLTWTFYLREGILFHNGKEMTSEDVVASFIRWVKISPSRKLLTDVAHVNAIDKYTVEVKCDEKMGALMAIAGLRGGHLAIMPKEVCDGVPSGKLTEYIGTGPYKLAEYKIDQYAKLERFDDYQPVDSVPSGYAGKKSAYFDTMMIYFVPETSTLLAGLETGEFDFIEPIQPMEVDRLKESGEITLQHYPKWSLSSVFNTKGILGDARLRKAMYLALDMEEVMLSVGKKPENFELVCGNYRADSIWYTGNREKYYNKKDIDGAKKLMKEAGYNGEELTILTTKHYPWAFDMAISIEEQLSKIGFNFKLDVVDWPTLVSKRAKFEGWDIFTSAGTLIPDPVMVASNFTGDYPGWYTSPEMIELLTILLREDDFETRYAAWERLENILAESPASIKPGWTYEFRGFRSNIKGIPMFSESV